MNGSTISDSYFWSGLDCAKVAAMIPGELYIWAGCFMIDKIGRTLSTLALFAYCENGELWPPPIVGVNVSKMPQGEGTKERRRQFGMAKRN